MVRGWKTSLVCGLVLYGFSACVQRNEPWKDRERLAEVADLGIVDRLYGGGERVDFRLKSFTYDAYTRSYRIRARISWQGIPPGKPDFWSEGVLAVTEGGHPMTWCAESMSYNLQNHLSDLELKQGGIGTTVEVYQTHRGSATAVAEP